MGSSMGLVILSLCMIGLLCSNETCHRSLILKMKKIGICTVYISLCCCVCLERSYDIGHANLHLVSLDGMKWLVFIAKLMSTSWGLHCIIDCNIL